MGILSLFSSNNKHVDDIEQAEAKIREESPYLLEDNEHLELAFRSKGELGRDKSYLTSHRVLIQDGKGLGSKRVNYLSIPYGSIKAFSVQTAGHAATLDWNTELNIWYDGSVYGPKTIKFLKGRVDLFRVKQFFNDKVFGATASATLTEGYTSTTTPYTSGVTPTNVTTTAADLVDTTSVESVIEWIGNDAIQLDPKSVQERFGPTSSASPVLMVGEVVEVAYQARRDVIVLTPTRLFVIDVKGLTGQKIEFFSMKWECVKAFSVETAGQLDWDYEFLLHTNIPGLTHIKQDLRIGKVDIFELQMVFSNKLLCNGNSIGSATLAPGIDLKKGHVDQGAALIGGGNNRPLDATEVERIYRSSPRILQDDEYVEMAFRGRRDLVIFTTKRIIDINVKGFSGTKVEYTSIPYSSVIAFAVKTAGKHMDRDAEVIVYTEVKYNAAPHEEEPDPGLSCLEWDFNKDVVDILNLKRYLNTRLLATERGMKVPTGLLAAAKKEKGMSKLMSKFGGDQRVIDADELNAALHDKNVKVLLDNENVVMAFKAGRDISCFTNKRIFVMDVQGWSGEKIEYTSIPYSSVRGFSAESAGGWDRDSNVNIYTKNYWTLAKLKLDFRKGKADIIAIQKFLSAIVLGNEQDAANYLSTTNSNTVKIKYAPGMNSFTDWIIDKSVEVDADVANAQFHNDPPILLSDESVEKVYREGRDLWIYTNLRVLTVNVKGMSGKKIKYKSIRLKDCIMAYAVETAGNAFDRDAECYMMTNIPWVGYLKQRLLVKHANIFDMHQYLGKKLLSGERPS